MPKENRKKALDDAARCVLQDRNNAYDEPEENFERIVRLRAVVSECKHPLARVALDEICLKIARLVFNPTHYDSWVDIAGYAACGADVTTSPKEKDDAPSEHPWGRIAREERDKQVQKNTQENLSEEMTRVTKDFIAMNHKDPNLEAARADNFRHWVFQDGKLVKVG